MTKTTKLLVSSMAGALLLGALLGWRGSLLAQRTQVAALNRALQTEAHMSAEAVAGHVTEFEGDVFNVVSAEFWQHNSRLSGATSELADSPFYAVGLLEIKPDGFVPAWWSVSPKARGLVTTELLQSFLPDWDMPLRQMGRRFFVRAADLKQSPLMIFVSRIQLPNAQGSALAVAALPPEALHLNVQSMADSFLWDQQGYIWGYRNSSYVGSALKNDPLVRLSLRSDDETKLRFHLNGRERFGIFEHLPDSNLLVGVSREIPSIADILLNWWSSLLFSSLGAGLLAFALLRWIVGESETEDFGFVERPLPQMQRVQSRPAPVQESEDIRVAVPPQPIQPAVIVEKPRAPEPQPIPVETPASASVVPEPGRVLLDVILRRALTTFRHRIGDENVTVTENIAIGIEVQAKGAQLQTAIEEILKNALDAMKDSEAKSLTIEATVESGRARITIRDTGCGIAAGDTGRIFEPFYSTKQSRGLGLTVVKRLMEIVHGETIVESELGQGTAMVMYIPTNIESAIVQSPPPRLPERPSPLGDDDEELSQMEEMTMEQIREFAESVSIRKPRVRMDFTPVKGP